MNSNLEKEIQNYIEICRQSEQTISKLFQFFKTFAGDGIKLIYKSKKFLEEYFTQLRKEPSNTSNNISFLSFFNELNKYLENLKNIYLSIDNNIAIKYENLLKRMKNNHNIAIDKLSQLSFIINDNKNKLDKFKHDYFNSCKIVMEQEKKIIQLRDVKNVKQEDCIINNELLLKFVNASENQEGIYKNEIQKVNKVIENCEEKYPTAIKLFKEEYEFKLNFILNSLKEFKKEINNIIEINREIIPSIDKACSIVYVEKDSANFSEKNNYLYNNNKRFLLEKFLDYNTLRNNGLIEEIDTNYNDPINKTKSFKNFNKLMKIVNLGNKKEIKIELKNQEEKNIIDYLLNLITDDKKIDNKKYESISEFIIKNNDNIELVLDVLLNHCNQNSFMNIANLENLYLLSDLLKSIISISLKNKKIFDLCYFVLFIAEKSIYLDKDNSYNKCYLSIELSKEKIFSDSKFWTDLIIKKINILAETKSKLEIEKREKDKNGTNKNSGMFGKVMGMFNFNNDKNKENEIIENEILLGQIFEEKLPLYSVEVIEDYIQYFSRFNFDHKKASKLILEMAEKYKFEDSFVTYFLAKLNSNMCINEEDIKNNNQKEFKKLNYDKLYFGTSNNVTIKYKRVLDPKLRGIIYSLKYTEIKDFPNILALNKNYNKTLVKVIYKNILIKYHDMDMQKHINIWKILLNYSEIKKLYDYKKIKK